MVYETFLKTIQSMVQTRLNKKPTSPCGVF